MTFSIVLLVGVFLSLTLSLVLVALAYGWIARHPGAPRRQPILAALMAILFVNSWWLALGAWVAFKFYVLRQDT